MPKNALVRSSSRNDPHIINIAEEEDIEDYGPGGYLNVKVDDEFVSPNRRAPYKAIRKLGCALRYVHASPSSYSLCTQMGPLLDRLACPES
jgi:hypothetical protein